MLYPQFRLLNPINYFENSGLLLFNYGKNNNRMYRIEVRIMRKRHCILFITLLLIGIVMMGGSIQSVTATTEKLNEGQKVVILERHYLDGDMSEEIIIEELTYSEIRKKYMDWSFVLMNEDHIKFKKLVNDISPLLKSNGFFGITKDGTLSIFNGKPNDENIIHSFFQIDLGKLETRTQEQLVRGIPVRTKEEFIQVLEAFKPFSLTIGQ